MCLVYRILVVDYHSRLTIEQVNIKQGLHEKTLTQKPAKRKL